MSLSVKFSLGFALIAQGSAVHGISTAACKRPFPVGTNRRKYQRNHQPESGTLVILHVNKRLQSFHFFSISLSFSLSPVSTLPPSPSRGESRRTLKIICANLSPPLSPTSTRGNHSSQECKAPVPGTGAACRLDVPISPFH